MPRYFFIVQTLYQRINDDEGATLENDDEALTHAQNLIKGLRREGDCDGWSMIIRDTAGRVVSSIPV